MKKLFLIMSIFLISLNAFADQPSKACIEKDCPIPANFDYLTQGKVFNNEDRLTLINYYKKLEHSRQVLLYDVADAYNQSLITDKTYKDYKAFLAWSDHIQFQTQLKDWPQYQEEFNARLDKVQAEINKDLTAPCSDIPQMPVNSTNKN